jgi:hypothetical protein
MMSETEREQAVRKPSPEERPKFDEAPGEAEADAVRDAFLKNTGAQPEQVASALAVVDSSTRLRAVNRLQRQRGNGYVQRVARSSGAPGRMVGLPQSAMVDEVQQRKGSGSELPAVARQPLEDHFGADLSQVRVHTDNEAAALNRELQAQAFTVGNDVFMGEGKYDPTSSEGQGLLAHELTHVGQQTGFSGQGVQRAGEEEEEEVQREAVPEEEEENLQREAAPEEEELSQS